MSGVRLAVRQLRYEQLAFWRNPPAAFFTFAFPLIFLVIFNLVFGNETIEVDGGSTKASTFFVAGIAALSVVNGCFTGLAMALSILRDEGVLKRVRGTPLPPWAYLAGRIGFNTLLTLLLIAIVVAVGALFYDVDVPTSTMPAFLVTVVVGAATFAALAFAVSGFVPNADAAPAVVNGVVLPLLFISDVFIRADSAPGWLNGVAAFFPVVHLSSALQVAFNPFETGSGFEPGALLVMAVWGVFGVVVALRFFSWEPRR
ncbi:MAG: ABC transporter permease [Dehalococcoidia bacterium]